MKTSHIFWGIFFLSLGILILLNNYSSLHFDLPAAAWETLLKLSPIILILWGISILVKQNKFLSGFFAALIGFALAVVIFSGFKLTCNFSDWDFGSPWRIDDDSEMVFDGNIDSTFYSEPFNSETKNAKLNFDGGASEIIISDTTESLIQAYTIGVKNNYKFYVNNSVEMSKIYFDVKETGISFKEMTNKIELKLNKSPVWDLDFDLGAAEADFDLSKFKVEKVNIDVGAASLDIKLGNLYNETKVDIDAGASSIKIEIPKSSGCEINSDVFLSSEHFNGFNKINSDKFRTENFDLAEKKIYINIDSGVSSVKVNRYESR